MGTRRGSEEEMGREGWDFLGPTQKPQLGTRWVAAQLLAEPGPLVSLGSGCLHGSRISCLFYQMG